MKNNMLQPIIFMCLTALLFASCTAKTLPNVKNATYESYDVAGERGYHVTFEVSHDSIPATSVVINRIQQMIVPENKNGFVYHVDVIAQSRKLFGFKAKVVDRANGVFFKTGSTEVFKPISFKLKTK